MFKAFARILVLTASSVVVSSCGGNDSPKTYSTTEIRKDDTELQKALFEFLETYSNPNATLEDLIEDTNKIIRSAENYERKYGTAFHVKKDGTESLITNNVVRRSITNSKDGDQLKMPAASREEMQDGINQLKKFRKDLELVEDTYGKNTLLKDLPGFSNRAPSVDEKVIKATLPNKRPALEMVQNEMPKNSVQIYRAPSFDEPSIPFKQTPSPTIIQNGSVSGVVYSSNESGSVPNLLVYLPLKGNENQKISEAKILEDHGKELLCGEPAEEYLLKTCTNSLGEFEFENLTDGLLQIHISNGSALKTLEVTIVKGEDQKVAPQVDFEVLR